MNDALRDTVRSGGVPGRCSAIIAAWCTVFVSGVFSAGTLTADTIVRVNGTTIDDVKIIDARWDLVQYELARGRPQRISGDQIASIDRVPDNSDLRQGRLEQEKGDYSEAARRLERVAGAAKPWEQAEAAYRLGEVYLGAGEARKAEEQLKAYLNAHEKSKDWWVPRALYSLGNALTEMKQYETAELSFKKLEDMPGEWALRAQVGRARAIEASNNEGKFLQARQLLLSVAKGRTTPPELRDEAYVVRGWIFLRQKQYDSAIKELTAEFFDPSKVREYRYDARRAEATYLMGRAYRGLGGKKNLEQAELWLLRVPALYPNRGRIYILSCRTLASVYKDLGNDERAADWARRGK